MTRWAWIAVVGSSTLAFVLAIVLVVVIAVDGGSDEPAAAEAPAAVAPEGGQTFGPLGGTMPPEVAECLEEAGVETPGADGTPPDSEEVERMQEVLEECGLPAPRIVTPGSQ